MSGLRWWSLAKDCHLGDDLPADADAILALFEFSFEIKRNQLANRMQKELERHAAEFPFDAKNPSPWTYQKRASYKRFEQAAEEFAVLDSPKDVLRQRIERALVDGKWSLQQGKDPEPSTIRIKASGHIDRSEIARWWGELESSWSRLGFRVAATDSTESTLTSKHPAPSEGDADYLVWQEAETIHFTDPNPANWPNKTKVIAWLAARLGSRRKALATWRKYASVEAKKPGIRSVT